MISGSVKEVVHRPLYFVCCDAETNTGEGRLFSLTSELVLKNIPPNLNITNIFIFTPPKQWNLFNRFNHLKYLWLFWKILVLRVAGRRAVIVLVNYLPIWNFVTFLLVDRKMILAPITGNEAVSLSRIHRSTVQQIFILFLQNSIIQLGGLISKLIIKIRKLRVVAATPAVRHYFYQKPDRPLYIWAHGKTAEITNALARERANETVYDFMVYTNNHRLKNNNLLIECLRSLNRAGLKGLVVGPVQFEKHSLSNITFIKTMKHEEFIESLKNSLCLLNLTLEQAGFAAFEASLLGVPVLGFKGTGSSNLPSFVPVSETGYVRPNKLAKEVLKIIQNIEFNPTLIKQNQTDTERLGNVSKRYYGRYFRERLTSFER